AKSIHGQAKRMPYKSDGARVPDISRQFLGSNLAQDSAQLVEVHRFRKVKIEPGVLAPLDVLGCSKAGERYGFDTAFSLGLGNDVVAAAVRQSDVTQDDIEFFCVNDVQRVLRAIGHGNFMAKMTEKTRQRFQRVAVIFDHQDTQPLA